MKRNLLVLMVLVFLCCAAAACAGGETKKDQVSISMTFSANGQTFPAVSAGDQLWVTIRIENISGEDFDGEMRLFDPAHKEVLDFPNVLLKAGEKVEWSGEWTITEEQIRTQRLMYRVQYRYLDGKRESKQITLNFSKKLTLKDEVAAEPAPEASPAPTPVPEKRPQVFLYSVNRPDNGEESVSVACMDQAGDLWFTDKADVKYPFREEDVLQLIQERRGMKRIRKLIFAPYDMIHMSEGWFEALAGVAETVPAAEGEPEKTGASDHALSICALRTGQDGSPETVLLGISGSKVFENKDPDAQFLYLFMWRILMEQEEFFHFPWGLAAEGMAPRGAEMVSIRQFFGLEKADAETSVVTRTVKTGGETGEEEPAPKQERKKALKLLDRGVVTGKWNRYPTNGEWVIYSFYSAEGEYLGRLETCMDGEVAEAEDGVYRLSVLPPGTEGLSEEETRMLTLMISGRNYMLGKNTPRDLIRDGWACKINRYNMLMFRNGDKRNTDYGTVYTTVYGDTVGKGLDEPLTYLSIRLTSGLPNEYCGFDGNMDPDDPEDPDTVWRKKAAEAKLAEHPEWISDPEDPVESTGPWEGLAFWLKSLGGEDPDPEDDEDEIELDMTLSNGYVLNIRADYWLPVSLQLEDPDTLVNNEDLEDDEDPENDNGE